MTDVSICPMCLEVFAKNELCKCERQKTGQLTSEDMEWMDIIKEGKVDMHLNRVLEMLESIEKSLKLMIWQQQQEDTV